MSAGGDANHRSVRMSEGKTLTSSTRRPGRLKRMPLQRETIRSSNKSVFDIKATPEPETSPSFKADESWAFSAVPEGTEKVDDQVIENTGPVIHADHHRESGKFQQHSFRTGSDIQIARAPGRPRGKKVQPRRPETEGVWWSISDANWDHYIREYTYGESKKIRDNAHTVLKKYSHVGRIMEQLHISEMRPNPCSNCSKKGTVERCRRYSSLGMESFAGKTGHEGGQKCASCLHKGWRCPG